MVYLGLSDDEEFDQQFEQDYGYDPYEEYTEADAQPERARPARPSREQTIDLRQDTPTVRPITRDTPMVMPSRPVRTLPNMGAVQVVVPASFNDAQQIGDALRNGQPVVVNLQGQSKDLQRRLIDFASGLTYALGGNMSRIADEVFLIAPSNVEVSEEEKERLEARGLFRR